MKLIKVIHISTVHPAFDTRIFHKECNSLAKAGYCVTLIAQHNKNEIVNNVNIIAIPKDKNRIYRILFLPLKVFGLALRQKADIYHFHDPELLLIGVFLKIFTRKKVIYDVHEDYPKQILSKFYIPKISRKFIACIVKKIEYFSSKYFDAIIVVTDDILRNFSYHKKVVSIKNYPKVSVLLNIKKRNTNIFNLVYIGGLVEIRGITQTIQALEYINSDKKVELTLCGKFTPVNYEDKVKRLKGSKKVNYLGWIEYKKIFSILEASDVGMVCFLPEPNHINAMPNKMFEYMIAGLPVIASNFSLWKEIVEGNKCGVCVDPLDPKGIAKAIEYLTEHPEETKQMGENGRKAVLEKYNWKNESKKLLEIYEELIRR